MTLGKRHGEYRVAFPNDEASAYYTDDLEDAVWTAKHMAARRDYDRNPDRTR
jgi:hypothetical protein